MGRLAQGRLGYVNFTPNGGSQLAIPVYDWQIQSRRNRVTGDPVGNTWSTNYADGMGTSRFTARILVRKTTLEAFAAGFINNFVTRTFSDGVDDTKDFVINAADGAAQWQLTGAKPESFTLTIAKGSPVGLSVVFVSPFAPTLSSARQTDYSDTVDNTKLMMFDAATFKKAATAAGLAAGTAITEFYNAELTYSNNHIVNAPLDGTLNAASFDAGVIRCGANFTVKAHHGSTGDLPPFNNESALRIALALGGSNVINFDLTSVVLETDLDGNANVGASYRTWQAMVLGTGGGSILQPLVIN